MFICVSSQIYQTLIVSMWLVNISVAILLVLCQRGLCRLNHNSPFVTFDFSDVNFWKPCKKCMICKRTISEGHEGGARLDTFSWFISFAYWAVALCIHTCTSLTSLLLRHLHTLSLSTLSKYISWLCLYIYAYFRCELFAYSEVKNTIRLLK